MRFPSAPQGFYARDACNRRSNFGMQPTAFGRGCYRMLRSLEMIRDSGKLKSNRETSEGQCNGRSG